MAQTSISAQIALNRFGMGAKAAEAPPADPRRWLLDQIGRFDPSPAAIAALPRTPAQVAQLAEVEAERKDRKEERKEAPAPAPAPMMENGAPAMPAKKPSPEAGLYRPLRDSYTDAVSARMAVAGASDTPFMERLVAFWSNHFAVSIDKVAVVGLAGPFENEAIRPHLTGRFTDMLFAAVRHPAMLLFLDQAQSVGPNSMIAEVAHRRGNAKQPGLNENLAREIMELHTLGVRSGYSQADVTEFARALTGITVSGLGRIARLVGGEPGSTIFVPQLHEPGSRMVMGKKYGQAEEKQALSILLDLATHPATARHIATKLARHFTSDDPPATLVARLEKSFHTTGGDLPSLYRVLIESPEPWDTSLPPKFRPPWDWLVALRRASGVDFPAQPTVFALNQLGQPIWKPGSPAGWDDIAASWAAPDALLRRVEFAQRLGQKLGAIDARKLAPTLFPDALSESTAQAIARAESPAQALSLLFVSPEMLRR